MRESFLAAYSASRAQLPNLPSLTPLQVPLSTPAGRPSLTTTAASMTAQLAKAHEYFKGGKFSNVVTICQGVLQALPLVVVETRQQQPEVTELFASARRSAPRPPPPLRHRPPPPPLWHRPPPAAPPARCCPPASQPPPAAARG